MNCLVARQKNWRIGWWNGTVRGILALQPHRWGQLLETHHPQQIEVLVDNEAARENVIRFLESQGYTSDISKRDGLLTIVGINDDSVPQSETAVTSSTISGNKIMVMVSADQMGSGDNVLGAKLMVNFIKTLKEMGDELWRLVFINSGVKLTTDDSESLEDLRGLEKAGLAILVCGTCLDHFSLLERKQVGQTTNMLDIVTAMQLADKVINL